MRYLKSYLEKINRNHCYLMPDKVFNRCLYLLDKYGEKNNDGNNRISDLYGRSTSTNLIKIKLDDLKFDIYQSNINTTGIIYYYNLSDSEYERNVQYDDLDNSILIKLNAFLLGSEIEKILTAKKMGLL